MAGKKIFIEYDIDSSDLKIANGETLSLTQQLRILKKELQKGDLKPEQFDILRKKIGDTEDQIAKTTVKSKDFFGVLSALPGPVGQFGSSILGVVDTLKIFSSFTFRDIKNSLSDVLDDVSEIGGNFTGAKQSTDEFSKSANEASTNVDNLSDSIGEVTTETAAAGGVVRSTSQSFQDYGNKTFKATDATLGFLQNVKNLKKQGLDITIESLEETDGKLTQLSGSYVDAAGKTQILTLEQGNAIQSGKVLTNTTNGLTIAQQQATFWTTTLGKTIQGVLIGTGIGIAIVAIGELISLIYEWISGTKEAEAAQKSFNDELERTSKLLDLDLKAAKRRQDLRVAELKAQGASEKELQDESIRALKENLGLKQKALDDANNLYNKTLKRNDEKSVEDLKKIGDEQLKLDQDVKDLRNQIKIAELQDDIKAAEDRKQKQKEANDKLLAQQKEYQQKRLNDTITAENQLRELIQGNAELKLRDEQERQFQELKNQKENEELKIKALLISEDLRGKLLEQVRLKYGYKLLNMQQKFQEEGLKSLIEFQRKREDIETAAIENVRERENKEREIKLRREIEDLQQDKEFIKLSEEEKEKIKKNIRQKYANEEKEDKKARDKEDADDRLKKLDDELRFLQIRQESIRAGTKAFWDGQRDILKAAEAREIEAAEGKEKEITAIKAKYVKLRNDLDQQEKLATIAAIGETIGAFANLTAAIASGYDEEAKTSEKAFEQRKKLQIATATMSAASGIIQILTQPSTLPSPFDWIVKGINAAALAISTAVQIKNIKNTKFQAEGGGGEQRNNLGRGYAEGGLIGGRRHAQGGTMIEAEAGEAVMTRGAVTMFAPLLSMLNQAGGGTSFNTPNMMVTSPDNPNTSNPSQNQQPIIMKTYVVENELTSTQQKQARLKDLSTL